MKKLVMILAAALCLAACGDDKGDDKVTLESLRSEMKVNTIDYNGTVYSCVRYSAPMIEDTPNRYVIDIAAATKDATIVVGLDSNDDQFQKVVDLTTDSNGAWMVQARMITENNNDTLFFINYQNASDVKNAFKYIEKRSSTSYIMALYVEMKNGDTLKMYVDSTTFNDNW